MATRTVEEQAILDNIIACLNHKGCDQKELCQYLGKSTQIFTNWKNKDNNSYMKYLPQIAEFFGVTVDHLMGKVVISQQSELEERLLKYFSLCDADRKLRIIQYAMNLFDEMEKEKTDFAKKSAI